MSTIDTEAALKRVKSQIQFTQPQQSKHSKKRWLYTIAATVLLAVAAIYLMRKAGEKTGDTIPAVANNSQEIMPVAAAVTLTLGNGKQMNLSAEYNRINVTEAGTRLVHDSGSLQYVRTSNNITTTFNTLATGAGSTYHVVLSDGTKAWLNAGSSLTYPVQFGSRSLT